MRSRANVRIEGPGRFVSLTLLYGASGLSALALETLWIRECLLRTGGTVIAAALVIGAFFLGSAVGNRLGAAAVSRCQRPLRRFAMLEGSSAVATVCLFLAVTFGWDFVGTLGPHASMTVLLLAVAIPAALSGAAFPMLSEALVAGQAQRVPSGAILYGSNLIGAACGVIAGAVLLPWHFGMLGAFLIAAGIQATAAGIAFALSEGKPVRLEPKNLKANGEFWPITLFAMCGGLSLATQAILISWARQIQTGSLYVVSGVLGAFILGLGAGALIVAFLRRRGTPATALLPVFAFAAAAMLLAAPSLGAWLVARAPELLGNDPLSMMLHALGWSVLLLGPLTSCLGAIFPLSWDLITSAGKHEGGTLGRIVSWNKLGAAFGMIFVGFFILPIFGLINGTFLIAGSYLAIGVTLLSGRSRRRRWIAISIGGAAVAFCLAWRPIEPLGLRSIDSAVASYDGAYGPVAVVDDGVNGSRFLLLNSQQRLNGTATALASQRNQGWLPMVFAANASGRVATIGMASGISTAAILDFPVEKVWAIELVPEVAQAAREHFEPWSGAVFKDPRVEVLLGDGRQVLQQLPGGALDVVICDLLFPNEEGSANLYSREFFGTVREKLANDGLFCLWLPTYQLSPETAGIIVRTFAGVFPNALMVRANFDPIQPVIGLLGSVGRIPLGRDFLEKRLKLGRVPEIASESVFLRSPENAWLAVVGDLHGETDLSAWPITTDDRPVIAFLGPKNLGDTRLIGVPFAKWIERSFPLSSMPSADLGQSPIEAVLGPARAGRFYFVSSVANSVIPGDVRPESARLEQTLRWWERAERASPARINIEDLGR